MSGVSKKSLITKQNDFSKGVTINYMMLPTLSDLDIKGKRALVRLDLDVPVSGGKVVDDSRLKAAIPTLVYLLQNGASQITILGHRGRPKGKVNSNLMIAPIAGRLRELLQQEMPDQAIDEKQIYILENLRFDPREEENSIEYAKELGKMGDLYINDAFAVSHREVTSIVALPFEFKSRYKNSVAAGLNLEKEIKVLSGILDNAKHPIVFVLGGGKLDKVPFVEKLLNFADEILVGGVLPKEVHSYCRDDAKICVAAAHLTSDGRDITPDSARNFAEVIGGAKTIIWNGPVGDVDSNYWDGTRIVAEAIAKSSAIKIAGGGDTIGVIAHLGISSSFDYISTGGGAFLEFLAEGDLPGLKALRA